MISSLTIATALRKKGFSVLNRKRVPSDDMSNYWLIDGVVLNCQTFSVLGKGCYRHPDYKATQAKLVADAEAALTEAGIPFQHSLTPDQIFLNGYEPKSYTPDEMARWRALNAVAKEDA